MHSFWKIVYLGPLPAEILFSYRKPATSFSLRYDVQLGEITCICWLNFDVNGLNDNLEMSQIYDVSMIKRIQTSCCDFAGFKTCKKMQLTHRWCQHKVRHTMSMWHKRMQHMKIMLQRLVPHIRWQFLLPSKQIVRKETRQSHLYLNVL